MHIVTVDLMPSTLMLLGSPCYHVLDFNHSLYLAYLVAGFLCVLKAGYSKCLDEYLHLDAGPRAPVQAALDCVCQSSILDGVKGNAVARVCDGVHLLDEGQSREGGVAVHHLVQDAAQAPNV